MDNKDILYDILTADDVVSNIRYNMDILLNKIPEIRYMINFDQKNPNHHLDVWSHTLYALSLSENSYEIRLVLLFHDIGKPFSYTEDKNGIRHFWNHPKVSAKMTYDILKRFDFDEKSIDRICYLVNNHDTRITKNDVKNNYELAYERLLIQECDILAHNPNTLEKREKYLKLTRNLF